MLTLPRLAFLGLTVAVPLSVFAQEDPFACGTERKTCPDGSTVGLDIRNNCEFAECPTVDDEDNGFDCPFGQCPTAEQLSCEPYRCPDGTQVERCADDGSPIQYFADPCLTHGGGEVQTSGSFTDVPADHPNAEAIEYVRQQGIVEGYEDGTFRPDQSINRAEFIKIVMAAQFTVDLFDACMTSEPVGALFPDMRASDWFAQYVCLAWSKNIVAGYPDGRLRPETSISFVEAAKVVVKVFIGDVLTEATWYKPFVERLEEYKAIPMSIRSFDQRITRGEMAEMVFRLKTARFDKPSRTYGDLGGGADATIVTVYLSSKTDGLYTPVQVTVPHSTSVLAAALNALFRLPMDHGNCYDAACTLMSDLYLSDLSVSSASIIGGIATVEIEGSVSFESDLAALRAREEIERTIRYFLTVHTLDVTINGHPIACLSDGWGLCR